MAPKQYEKGPDRILLACPIRFTAQSKEPVYIFSYFKGNGEDGLHPAYSNDGYNWTALRHD